MSTDTPKPPHILISYDVDVKQTEIKNALLAIGYIGSIFIGDVEHNLPDTTLFRKYTSTEKAFSDIGRIVKLESATLQRCVVTQCFEIEVI